MNKRDKAIYDAICKFRVLSRDQIIRMFFSKLKSPVSNCNLVLKRLTDRQYIRAEKNYQPFLYMPHESAIRGNSQKLLHFLAIADAYLDMASYSEPKHTIIECKLGEKGTVEPDLFAIWKNTPFFIEVQRSHYTAKFMEEKIQRYVQYYQSGEWRQLEWQRAEKQVFPVILILTDTRYQIPRTEFPVLQFPSVQALIEHQQQRSNVPPQPTVKQAAAPKSTLKFKVQ